MAHLIHEADLISAIDKLEDLKPFYRDYIKDRWVKYLIRWDNRAAETKWKHFTLRTIVVIGAVLIPALIGTSALLPLSEDRNKDGIQWFAFGLSLLVGIAAALEELFRFGEIWRDKRAAEELLHCEGWRYMKLVGKYKGKSYDSAFTDFASTVEDMIEHEIKDYFLVTRPKEEANPNLSNG
jgi:hypothetical protein